MSVHIRKHVNPEVWALLDDGEIVRIMEDLAMREGIRLRRFRSVSETLGVEQPPGGIVFAIDASDSFSNYRTIIRRFQKNFFLFDVVVFDERKKAVENEQDIEEGVDLHVSIPVEDDDLNIRLSHLVSLRRLKSSANIIGRSKALNEMLETVLQVAPTEVSVLIQGESGSGKEITARAIHISSGRADRPFEAVNCGALAEGVLESELFGHEKGSFTGAISRRQGLFERANGGTLFLDEVGEMSLNMQVRLLRVIDTGELMRVGGTEQLKTDVRIIAATNRELETSVENGRFRKDLYYRLRVVQIRIPSLRSRPEDIPLLANYFLERSVRKHGRKIRGIQKGGMDLLVRYPWPGNVRELANTIDSLAVLGRETTIGAQDIEKHLQERMTTQSVPDLPVRIERTREEMERELILNSLLSLHKDVREILHVLVGGKQSPPNRWHRLVEIEEARSVEPRDLGSIERDAIREALIASGGNRRKAARQLGISERTLYRRIKEYKLA